MARFKRSPVSHPINISFVERNNPTLRHHNRRLVRKTIAFSSAIIEQAQRACYVVNPRCDLCRSYNVDKTESIREGFS